MLEKTQEVCRAVTENLGLDMFYWSVHYVYEKGIDSWKLRSTKSATNLDKK